jgi:hypothetical protein
MHRSEFFSGTICWCAKKDDRGKEKKTHLTGITIYGLGWATQKVPVPGGVGVGDWYSS